MRPGNHNSWIVRVPADWTTLHAYIQGRKKRKKKQFVWIFNQYTHHDFQKKNEAGFNSDDQKQFNVSLQVMFIVQPAMTTYVAAARSHTIQQT